MEVKHFAVLNPALKPYIDYYYLLSTAGEKTVANYYAFPSNNVPVCFFNDCAVSIQPQRATIEKAVGAGPVEISVGFAAVPVEVNIASGIREFCIIFLPGGLNCFTGGRHCSSIGNEFSVTDFLKEPLCGIIPKLLRGEEAIGELEEKLISLLDVSAELRSLGRMIEMIETGDQSVASIAETLSLSYKSCYRIFKKNLGISPAQFRSKSRFRDALNRLNTDNYKNKMTGMALDSGYYDQAHLVNEFKKNAGRPPAHFMRSVTLMAEKRIAWKFL